LSAQRLADFPARPGQPRRHRPGRHPERQARLLVAEPACHQQQHVPLSPRQRGYRGRKLLGGRLTDWVSLGVLASSVPRDAVDEAIAVMGRQARRRDGKLPPHVVVYLVMALALFADDDYEEAAARLTRTLASWGCWDEAWEVPTSGGITQARQRLGYEPMRELFSQVAVPVADQLTRGAFLGRWRLMSIDGFEWDVPDTAGNAAAFGYSGAGPDDAGRPAFPKTRVVTVSECASHAVADAEIGGVAGKGAGEQSLARGLYRRLDEDWLLIADRNFYNWADWCTAADSGAALLWRVKADLTLPVLELLPDGSYSSVLVSPKASGKARQALIAAARAGEDLEEDKARYVRVIEYEVPDRDGDGKDEVIVLITTITEMTAAPGPLLAQACHQRWEHETGKAQLKTHLRGPGRVLRSKSPDMVRQEIYGYLLTHYAISALICRAATEADIDPDRVKFKQAVRMIRRQAAGPAAFPP
jgi:Insertion element 4 transposase N-terminal